MSKKQIQPCTCGAKAELKITTGGFNYYYAIHCTACDRNSRGRGNILPQLFSSDSDDVPQASEADAIAAWARLTKEAA